MNNLANLYRDEGNFVEAEKLLNSALELRPQFATAWMNLGILYSTKGSFNDSENCYFEALKHRKHYPDCYYNLGNLVCCFRLFMTGYLKITIYYFLNSSIYVEKISCRIYGGIECFRMP